VSFKSRRAELNIVKNDETPVTNLEMEAFSLDLKMTEGGTIFCKVHQNDIKVNANPLLIMPYVQ